MVSKLKAAAVITVLIILCVFVLSSCGKEEYAKAYTLKELYAAADGEYDAISMEDIYIPPSMDLQKLGLFFASNSGWVRYDSENVPFDSQKPIIIFAHGMGTGSFGPYRAKWLAAGYNVGCFMWSQFSDDSPFIGQSKVWGIYNGKMRWSKNSGGYEKNDVPSHSVAEIYAACYNDFMSQHDFCGSEIRLYGHSLGAQLTVALSSYFMSAVETGKMNPEYLPDRVSLLDPYLSNDIDAIYVTWLDKTLEDCGSVKATLDTVIRLKNKGIAVELVRSSPWVEIAALAYKSGEDGYNEALKDEVAHLSIDTGFLPSKYGMIDGIAACHEVGEDWYSGSIDKGLWTDNAANASGGYGISSVTPTSYTYARMGSKYELDINESEKDYSDDIQRSVNINSAKIAGFVFLDKNSNGIMDDRLCNRLSNVTVTLYEKGKKKPVTTYTTGTSGYYEFLTEVGKNYYIKVSPVKNYAFSQITDADSLYMSNNIGSDGISAIFTPANSASLIIVNAGIIAN
ncbi:MAG: hypothetical protein EOM87_01990 [Clostridia bacterium]|nr:hypothetical protein [Clostridia bacterium]